jgi:Fe-S-cluster-containing hydrogenase component 2
MSVVIQQTCVTCGACEWECPNEAISPGSVRPVVDAQRCTECYGFFGESQCMVACPVSAIVVDRLESTEVLAERFRHLHRGMEMQDTWIWQRLGSDSGHDASTSTAGRKVVDLAKPRDELL